jgi:hypothetical protein
MLTMKNKLIVILSLTALLQWSDITKAHVVTGADFLNRARVDEKTLATVIPDPQIWAYDLSPDGTRLALFVVSMTTSQAPADSWIVLASATTSEILKQVRFGTRPAFQQSYAPQIVFTHDGKFLVLQDQQTVSVLDSASLTTFRTISSSAGSKFNIPASIVIANGRNIAAVSFGTGDARASDGKWPMYTAIVDLSTGKQVAGWEDNDIPFSLSPRGDFLAVPDHSTAEPVMGVKILDAKSGKVIVVLPAKYSYPKEVPKNYFAVIVAKFLGDDELILTPNNYADQSGHDVGPSLNIVQLKNSNVVQQIHPKDYGPTGEVAVSADQSTFITVSRYLPPRYLQHPHWRIPSDIRPELLVFRKQQNFMLDSRMPVPPLLGLRRGGTFDRSGLRVSADGSVISIAEDYGITVLTRK